MKRPLTFLLLAALLIPALAACGNQGATTGGQATTVPAATSSTAGSSGTAQLRGSGASFPDPIYQRWIKDYQAVAPNVQIDYQSVGSGQGRKDFFGSLTDFGATDKFASDDELANAGAAVLHIPTVLGAVVATYNLPGVDKLQFSGETLAGIYLGQITKWNDAAIAADNPGVTLPDKSITVVYRADASGTTSIFTNYLSSVSPDWKSKVGGGDSVQWPVGIGAQKNPGVTQSVKQTEGAIGYVELIYALANKLPAPAIKNAAGQYTPPTLASVSAAAEGFLAEMPDDLRINIVNPPTGDDAYPISGFTWILVRQDMQDQAKARALVDFLEWALTKGDDSARALGYSPLPDSVREKALAKLESVTVNGQSLLAASR
jgi:phosphate transport system substrate-binding protein